MFYKICKPTLKTYINLSWFSTISYSPKPSGEDQPQDLTNRKASAFLLSYNYCLDILVKIL